MCFKRFGINRRCVVCFLAADSNGSCEKWVWWEEARCQDLLHNSCCVVPPCDVVGWDAAIPPPPPSPVDPSPSTPLEGSCS